MKHIKGDDISKILVQAPDVWAQVQQSITPNGTQLNTFTATQTEYNYNINYYSNTSCGNNTWNNTSYTYQSNYLKGGDIDDMYI